MGDGSVQRSIDDAKRLLADTRRCFDACVAALARDCGRDGRLDAVRVDERQSACFELAWVSADLLAADAALAGSREASSAAHDDALDTRLALVTAVDAVVASTVRLDALSIELDVATDGLRALAGDAAWAALRRATTTGAALAAVGRAVSAADGDVGEDALDETARLTRDAFRRFAAEVVAPLAEDIHRHDRTVPETLLEPLRAMGVFGLSIPERLGGSAADDRDSALPMVVVTEALSEASLAAAGSLITRPEILGRALLVGGTDAQKAYWLPRIAAGDPLVAIAITEPDTGSDVASLACRATPVNGGWRLDGAKTWCTFAGKAGLLMVVARTDPDRRRGHRGLSVFLVEKPSFDGHAFEHVQPGGGRVVGRAIPTIGYRGMHSFDVAFDGFVVPDANLIGGRDGLGRGFHLTMAGMTGGRLQTAARACGVMRAALKAALRYAADRRVFGAPLAEFQLTQVKLARMAARLAACRRLTYATARVDDDAVVRTQASLAKLYACRSAELVTREALQLFGGMGYAEESLVSRLFVDARVLSIFEGAEETLALKVIARGLLASALGRPVDEARDAA